MSPATLVQMDIWYQLFSVRLYAAYTLASPTTRLYVPKVRADSGVTADRDCAVAIEVTDGLRPSGGVLLSSSTILVISVVFLFSFEEGKGGL